MFCIFYHLFHGKYWFLINRNASKNIFEVLIMFFSSYFRYVIDFSVILLRKKNQLLISSPSVTSISWSNPINICYIFDCLQMAKQTTKKKYLHPKCIQLEISMLWCYILLEKNMKSYNLQYDMLVPWADVTNDSSTMRLTFQVFFHNFL